MPYLQMNKEECSQKMDELIISLASGSTAGRSELMRLVDEHADKFCGSYEFSAESMRSSTDAERKYVKKVEAVVNKFIVSKRNKNLKKLHSLEIDKFITKCALGMQCDDYELWRLAMEHAQFRSPHKMSFALLLEHESEHKVAKQLETRVNEIIAKTMQRERPMSAMSRCVMERFSMQPGPIPRAIMQSSCKCTGPKQSPNCKLPPALCKTATYSLSRTVPRIDTHSPKSRSSSRSSSRSRSRSSSPKAASLNTRKSAGGKLKSKSCKRRSNRKNPTRKLS